MAAAAFVGLRHLASMSSVPSGCSAGCARDGEVELPLNHPIVVSEGHQLGAMIGDASSHAQLKFTVILGGEVRVQCYLDLAGVAVAHFDGCYITGDTTWYGVARHAEFRLSGPVEATGDGNREGVSCLQLNACGEPLPRGNVLPRGEVHSQRRRRLSRVSGRRIDDPTPSGDCPT